MMVFESKKNCFKTKFYGFILVFPVLSLLSCTLPDSLFLSYQTSAKSAETHRYSDLVYHLLAGEFAARRADFSSAFKHYIHAGRLTNNPEVLKTVFRLAMHNKDYVNAVRFGEKWLALDPDNLRIKQLLAVAYVVDRRFEDAMSILQDVIGQQGVDESQIFTTLGATLLSEMPVEAKDRMKEMAEKFSDSARAQYVYAVFLLDTGDYDEVTRLAEKSAELDPDFANAYLLKAWALILSEKIDEGLSVAAMAVAKVPGDINVRGNYARLLLKSDRQSEALKEFRIIHASSPYNPDVMQAIGILSMQQGDLDTADTFFERLQSFPTRRAEAVYYKGRIAEERGDMDKSLMTYHMIPKGDFFKEAQISIAEVYQKMGDFKKAVKQLEKARELAESEQEEIEFYLAQGRILSDASRHSEAIKLYTQAIEEHGALNSLLYARGIAASEIGLLEQVEEDLLRILQDEPENAEVLNSLGYVFANNNFRLDEAKAYILRAYALDPHNPAILDSMGWIEFRLYNVEVAEGFIRQAMANLRDPEVLGHLVEILCTRKQIAEAEKELKKALEEFPDDDYLQRLRKSCFD